MYGETVDKCNGSSSVPFKWVNLYSIYDVVSRCFRVGTAKTVQLAITAIIFYAAVAVMASLPIVWINIHPARGAYRNFNRISCGLTGTPFDEQPECLAIPLVSQYFVDFLFGPIAISKIIIDMDIE